MFKRLVKSSLKRVGLKLVRVTSEDTKSLQRTVYHAHYRGREFLCYKNGAISEKLLTGGEWDSHLKTLLPTCLASRESRTVIEVGANVGASLLPLTGDFPDVTFHLFEPVPAFYRLLEKNAANYAECNVQLRKEAMSDEPGKTIRLDCREASAGAFVYAEQHEYIELTTTTLDKQFPNTDCALLKIDVDGFELLVLRGGRDLLRRAQPNVFIEFDVRIMRQLNINPSDLLAELIGAGYNYFRMYDDLGVELGAADKPDTILKEANLHRYLDLYAEVRQ